jgi:hypothetical protein
VTAPLNRLVAISSPSLPALVSAAGERARTRFLEFFAANIRNLHTRVGKVGSLCTKVDLPFCHRHSALPP